MDYEFQIDNEWMWVSLLTYEPTTEEKNRIIKALRGSQTFPLGVVKDILIRGALRQQGLMEKDGKIVKYEPPYQVGDWVVHGKSTCCVAEVLDKQIMVIAPSLFGGVKTLYEAADVHPWTLEDVKRGDYLCCNPPGGIKVIFISHGYPDNLYMAYAGCSIAKNDTLFFTEETCCQASKEYIRPAKDAEMQLLNEQIAANDMHWNIDRMELEKVDHSIKAVFPTSDYEQMRQEFNQLRKTVEALAARIGDREELLKKEE